MKSSTADILPIIGTAMGGGFYAGRIRLADQVFALIVSPKAEGEHQPTVWIPKTKDIPAAKSYNDGLTNTQAMAEAGSNLAKWALGLEIGGENDWYLPSQDGSGTQLEARVVVVLVATDEELTPGIVRNRDVLRR